MMLSPDWISFIYALNFPLNISQPVYLRQISQSLLWRLPSGSTLEKTFYGKPQAMLFIFFIYLWFFLFRYTMDWFSKFSNFYVSSRWRKPNPKLLFSIRGDLPGHRVDIDLCNLANGFRAPFGISLSLLSIQINPPIATCLWSPPGRNKSRRNRESYWNCSNSWSPRCPIQPRKWERFSEPERPCHLGSLWMWKHKRGGSVNI